VGKRESWESDSWSQQTTIENKRWCFFKSWCCSTKDLEWEIFGRRDFVDSEPRANTQSQEKETLRLLPSEVVNPKTSTMIPILKKAEMFHFHASDKGLSQSAFPKIFSQDRLIRRHPENESHPYCVKVAQKTWFAGSITAIACLFYRNGVEYQSVSGLTFFWNEKISGLVQYVTTTLDVGVVIVDFHRYRLRRVGWRDFDRFC